jgi:hypothetical protein
LIALLDAAAPAIGGPTEPENVIPFEKLNTPTAVLFNLRDHSADYLSMAARLATRSLCARLEKRSMRRCGFSR